MRNERKINLANCNFNFQNKNSSNTNKAKTSSLDLNGNLQTVKHAHGITLIALVVTIVVLLILAGISISTVLGNNGVIPKANEAKFKTDLANIQEEFNLYVMDKTAENGDFSAGSLAAGAGENTLYYNTKPDSETGSIRDILKSSTAQKYLENFEIIKGDLIFTSTSENNKQQELEWAQSIGLAINPYLIINGELMSSETNLMLIDKVTGTLTVPEKVTKIGAGAFRGENLRTIIIPETVEEIADYAFSGNTTLEDVIIEEPKTEGKGLKTIGSFAFQDCTAIKEIKIASTVSKLGHNCFLNCASLTSINFPKSLKVIEIRTIAGCRSITEVNVPEGVETISWSAFEECYGIQKVTIPASVKNISGGAFRGCRSLGDNIEINEGNTSFVFENGFLMSKDRKKLWYVAQTLPEINIPSNIEVIEEEALNGYPSFNAIILNIPSSVTEIKARIYKQIKSINVAPDNRNYVSENGNLYNKGKTTLLKWNQNNETVTIPNSVVKIKSNAFSGQNKIKDIVLPESLQVIESEGFRGTSIKHLNLPQNVNSVGTDMLDITVSVDSGNDTYMTVSGTELLSKDGTILHKVTKNMESYTIPSSVTTIGRQAFYHIFKLKNINIPSNVTSIDYTGFDWCESMNKIEISSNIQTIHQEAFYRCNNLKEIIIHKKEGEVKNAPWGCPYGLRAVKWD